jgi:uncharacterized 2Fe-2S/4Fe-4S cluster protein (DUF4445 family)
MTEGARIQVDGESPPFAITPGMTGLGAAVDIGTTTIAAYLYDLASGERVAAGSALNPQATFGADVISRIGASLSGHGRELARIVCGEISRLVRNMANAPGIQIGTEALSPPFLEGRSRATHTLDALQRIIIVGNTAMLYLLCELDTKPLSAMPFRADALFGEYRFPEHLDLPRSISVYLPRCMSAYVGADITASLLAGGLIVNGRVHDGAPRMLVDIGTNGEIALAAGGSLVCCATAAGPAFEGAGISCGMLAVPGAIDKADFSDGTIQYSTIGGAPATGLCGTGLVDTAAALLDAGLMDESGFMGVRCPTSFGAAGQSHALIKEGDFTFPGSDVAVSQRDMRQLQLAKAAICAGMLTLLAESGLTAADIGTLVIAGGFGSHIRASSAERIGLIPKGLAAKAISIGNGAGVGAGMMLLNDDIRRQSESIDKVARVVDLSTNALFMNTYVNCMMF